MSEAEMPVIAAAIATALRSRDDPAELEVIRKDVADLCARFPAYP
jgi:glycine/serine hydroxymethyltransferase